MQPTSIRSQVTTGFILIVGVLAAAYFLTIPSWNNYKSTKVQISSVQAQNASLNNSLQSLQSFVSNYTANQADAQLANQALPLHSIDSADLTHNIADIAAASGVALAGMEISAPVNAAQALPTANTIQTETINLGGSGSYASFTDFLQRLEQSLRLMDVLQASLKSDPTGLVQFNLELQVYYQQ